jgi:1-deoxy-D-xylulose-5-phosphate reductoisomerase
MKFPIVKLIKSLPERDSLFETIIVSVNDCLVKNFLNKKIKFLDITKFFFKIINDKELQKYKLKKPKDIEEIKYVYEYVRVKTNNLCI